MAGHDSEAIGKSDRRQTMGVDGYEKELLLHEKAVYTSCKPMVERGWRSTRFAVGAKL